MCPGLVTDDDLHASLAGLFGRPVEIPASAPEAEGTSSSSGNSSPPAGAAAAFNLDACMAMPDGVRR